jgi:hypothetical protein
MIKGVGGGKEFPITITSIMTQSDFQFEYADISSIGKGPMGTLSINVQGAVYNVAVGNNVEEIANVINELIRS